MGALLASHPKGARRAGTGTVTWRVPLSSEAECLPVAAPRRRRRLHLPTQLATAAATAPFGRTPPSLNADPAANPPPLRQCVGTLEVPLSTLPPPPPSCCQSGGRRGRLGQQQTHVRPPGPAPACGATGSGQPNGTYGGGATTTPTRRLLKERGRAPSRLPPATPARVATAHPPPLRAATCRRRCCHHPYGKRKRRRHDSRQRSPRRYYPAARRTGCWALPSHPVGRLTAHHAGHPHPSPLHPPPTPPAARPPTVHRPLPHRPGRNERHCARRYERKQKVKGGERITGFPAAQAGRAMLSSIS